MTDSASHLPSHLPKTTVIVMGVAGCGKSTVAEDLAERLGWPVVEGDDLHPPASKAKMTAGTPLTDADRIPWLTAIRDEIDRAPTHLIVTCSALRRSYRDLLGTARGRVRFLHLTGTHAVLGSRIGARTGHFMPASMLASQLDTLEPLQDDEDGVDVDIDRQPEEIIDDALRRLGLPPHEAVE